MTHTCPWASFMFPSLLPQTTRSTLETAPKLVNFCVCKSYFKNVVNSGATSLCGQILNYKTVWRGGLFCHLLKTHIVTTWVLKIYTNTKKEIWGTHKYLHKINENLAKNGVGLIIKKQKIMWTNKLGFGGTEILI